MAEHPTVRVERLVREACAPAEVTGFWVTGIRPWWGRTAYLRFTVSGHRVHYEMRKSTLDKGDDTARRAIRSAVLARRIDLKPQESGS